MKSPWFVLNELPLQKGTVSRPFFFYRMISKFKIATSTFESLHELDMKLQK